MLYFAILDGNPDLTKSESTTITADSLEDAIMKAKAIYKTDEATAVFQEECFDEDDEF